MVYPLMAFAKGAFEGYNQIKEEERAAAAELASQGNNAAANIVSNVPIVQVQEFDSVISMNSGEAVIMGGLMQDRVSSSRQGIPILGEVPLFGSLFRSTKDNIRKRELVVLLKATIIDGSNLHNTDKDLYRLYSGDRRPLDL